MFKDDYYIIADYENSIVTNYSFKYSKQFKSNKEVNSYIQSIKSEFDGLNSVRGLTANQQIDKKQYLVTITVDYDFEYFDYTNYFHVKNRISKILIPNIPITKWDINYTLWFLQDSVCEFNENS